MVSSVEQGTIVTVTGTYDVALDDYFYFYYRLSDDTWTSGSRSAYDGTATLTLDTTTLDPGIYTITVTDSGSLSGTATLEVTELVVADVTGFSAVWDDVNSWVELTWTSIMDALVTYTIVSDNGFSVTDLSYDTVLQYDSPAVYDFDQTISYTIYTFINGISSAGAFSSAIIPGTMAGDPCMETNSCP